MIHRSKALYGTGEISQLFRQTDWPASPLGPSEMWPTSLWSMVAFALNSPLAVAVVWGNELTTIYNDAYSKILGDKHPAVFGKSFRDLWPDFWENARPLVEKAYAGEPSFFEDAAYTIQRESRPEDAWVTFSCSPLFDEGGKIQGMAAVCIDTTEKVLLERARQEEHARMHALYEQAPGLVAIMEGPDHIISFTNRAYRDFVGGQDLRGRPIKEALPDIAAQGFGDLADHVFRSGEPFIGTEVPAMVHVWPQGTREERFFDFIYQPIRDPAGKVTGIFTEGIDVTERVKRAAAERESEQKIRLLADMIPQLVWIADPDGQLTWFNQRWLEYTGMTTAAALGEGWQTRLDPVTVSDVLQQWQISIETGTTFENTLRIRGSDGRFCPFYTLAVPLTDETGKVVQWFGTNTDVSNLEEAQAELRKTRNWLQQGLVTGRMVVWEWDLVTNQIKYSMNAKDVLGYEFREVEDSWARVHPEDVDRLRQVVNEAIEDRGSFHETSRRLDRATGSVTWVEQRGKVMCDSQGAPKSILGVNIDVTDRVMAELELKDASQRKDEFLAMLAHELRNPIAPISTAAYLLKIAGNDEKYIKQTSEIIDRQVRHMTELLDDLLDVSRVTRGLVSIQEEKVDIKSAIINAIEQARPLIEARNHVIYTRVASLPALVKGDHTRLVQVVTNLLNNACKYTPPGGEITVELHVLEGEIKLVITDNGIGIEADLLPRVFDLFTQAKRTPDRAQGGLGLGLALVHAMVALHGGRVEVESEGAGKGSTFSVYLPSIAESDNLAGSGDDLFRLPEDAKVLTLAIVDDNADAAELMAAVLRTFGHEVIVKNDAAGLLAEEQLSRIKVFVLDIGLPGLNGYELASQLRAQRETAQAVLIALTGYGQERDIEMARAAGFDHHMVKPVRPERLQELLANLP